MTAVIDERAILLDSKERVSGTTSVRILLVDDFSPCRELASLLLQTQDGFQIVGEARDGRDAIQKAKLIKPDLIVLDMNLPLLNGLEVARQIRDCSPASTILFLSANSDPEMVREAFHAGALGYIHKFDAVVELVEAAKAVLSGKRFISHRLRKQIEHPD